MSTDGREVPLSSIDVEIAISTTSGGLCASLFLFEKSRN